MATNNVPLGLLQDEEIGKKLPPVMSGDEADAMRFYIQRLNKARDERAMGRKEFDGMTFEQDYERNREALFSFLRPKLNDDDVRVNSGTAEKKIELMLTELISMNFQPEVRAYDRNNLELSDFSADLTDIVIRSNEQEHDDDTYQELFQDMLSQRCVYLEEYLCLEQLRSPNGVLVERRQPKKRRLSPLQVYLGDMYIPAHEFEKQPYIVIYDRILYAEAPPELTSNPKFQYVIPGMAMHEDYAWYFKYRFSTLRKDEIEIITYLSLTPQGLEKQVIVNSVMMYDPGYVMEGRTDYGITMVVNKTIPDFSYGKQPLASAKFLASLQDETLVNLIRKMRQAIEPPIGVLGGKVYSRDIWQPGAATQGIGKGNFERLIDHDGVSSSEFAMFQLITQKTEEFIGSVSIENEPGTASMTATQIMELQKQATKMLGLTVLGCSRLKRNATFLRLNSIFEEYLTGDKTTVFERIDGVTSGGETVRKTIVVLQKGLTNKQIQDIKAYEDSETQKLGYPFRMSFINNAILSEIPLVFRVSVAPAPQDSGSLDKILFQDKIMQAAQIAQLAGRQINGDKVVSDYENTWKAKGFFQKPNQGAAGQNGGVQGQAQGLLATLQGKGPSPTTPPGPSQMGVQPIAPPNPMGGMRLPGPKNFPGGATSTTRFGAATLGSLQNANKQIFAKGIKGG